MINTLLHRQAVPLDSTAHRQLKVPVPVADWSVAARLNSIFLAAVEFADACRDFPIVFVRAGQDPDGKPQIAPVAVFGLSAEENLFIEPDGQWRATYMPAVLRLYPFAIGRIDEQNFALCVDAAWSALSQGSGEALFDAQGEATEFTRQVVAQAEKTEEEVQRTRLVGERLLQLELLREMRFDVDLPGGQKLAVEGFFTVDEEKLKALPDATLVELARNGVLGLIQAHLISMANMRRLAEWRVQRGLQGPAAQAN
ncbi:MAG: SapC family protein [Rubrivivax sp.]